MADAYLLINDMGYDGIAVLGVYSTADARLDAVVKMAATPGALPYPSEGLYGCDVTMDHAEWVHKEDGALLMSGERLRMLLDEDEYSDSA